MAGSFDSIVALLEEESIALLARHVASVEIVPGDAPGPGRWIMAMIGFSSPKATGALTLVAAPAFWRSIAATMADVPPSDPMLADMAGEVANMLMGRLRHRLLALGVDVAQGTPTCAFGSAIVLGWSADSQTVWRAFSTSAGTLQLRCDAVVEDLALSLASDDAVQAIDSELILF